MYASGDRAAAVARLTDWSEDDLKREVGGLRMIRNQRGSLASFPLRPAVMLHTDRDLFETMQAPVVETSRECGVGPHAAFARTLATLLAVEESGRDFARRWFLAQAYRSHWDLCVDDAQGWTREGLKWFPKDAELLLARATALEGEATLTPRPPTPFSSSSGFAGAVTDQAHRRQDLEEARHALEQALVFDPDLHEARLRLGRLLWRLGRPVPARAALLEVAERASDPPLVYLAHLFLGRVEQDAARLDEAERHYREALAVDPQAQSAAVGLAHLLVARGEASEGREVLGRALRATPRPPPRDAYMSYHMGRAERGEAMLEALRAETLQ